MSISDNNQRLSARLESAMQMTNDVYAPPNIDSQQYFAGFIEDIRSQLCMPHRLSGEVMDPGFEDFKPGDVVTGLCLAFRDGYWLVYDEEKDRFYAFWGEDPKALGAHGVFGSPLYCWSA